MNCSKLLYVVFLITIATINGQEISNVIGGDNMFKGLGRITGSVLLKCWPLGVYEQQQGFIPIFQECLKQKLLTVLDKTLHRDNIEIFQGIEFVKINNDGNFSRKMENSVKDVDWENRILDTIVDIFETHSLTINLESFLQKDTGVNKARRRHRHGNHMMPFMLFGVVAMGMLLIPMGFKFLTVLGAKALLLAKMALILTSIQGLKKVATSGINYGLYHSHNPVHDRHGFQDVPDELLDQYFPSMRP